MTRPDWHEYWLTLAEHAASRATCPRASVGCVLVRDRTQLATGYNGAPQSLPHCEDIGCDIEDNHCLRAVHAEANAVASAARQGISTKGAVAYCTHLPCWQCARLLYQAGIDYVVYRHVYGLDLRLKTLPIVFTRIP